MPKYHAGQTVLRDGQSVQRDQASATSVSSHPYSQRHSVSKCHSSVPGSILKLFTLTTKKEDFKFAFTLILSDIHYFLKCIYL